MQRGLSPRAVEGRGGVEHRAVHHAPARAADDHPQPSLRAIQPVLQDCGQRGVRGQQVRQIVQYERPTPAGQIGLRGEPGQKRAPVRILHVREAGEPLGDRLGQIAPLHRRRRLIGDRIQAAAPPGPFDEQARLADPAAPPDDGERAGTQERAVQPAHFVIAIEKLHGDIMRDSIMFVCIIPADRDRTHRGRLEVRAAARRVQPDGAEFRRGATLVPARTTPGSAGRPPAVMRAS